MRIEWAPTPHHPYGVLHKYIGAGQNSRHIADDAFKLIFLYEHCCIFMHISLKFVPGEQIKNMPTLLQIMARYRSGDKALSEPTTYFTEAYMRLSASTS